jgi:hypothetical protein
MGHDGWFSQIDSSWLTVPSYHEFKGFLFYFLKQVQRLTDGVLRSPPSPKEKQRFSELATADTVLVKARIILGFHS